MAQRPTVTQMSRKFESRAFTVHMYVFLYVCMNDHRPTSIEGHSSLL